MVDQLIFYLHASIAIDILANSTCVFSETFE